MTAFETDDDIGKSGGTVTAYFGRGYRSSLGGTLVGSGGASNKTKRSSTSQNVPAIRVTRVDSNDDVDGGGSGGGDAVNGRPSSAPEPKRINPTARSQEGFFPPASGPESENAAIDGGISRSAPNSPKRPGLSGTVKKLLGTKDGLAQLRASLQGDDEDGDDENSGARAVAAARAITAAMGSSGRAVAVTKGEAVARAAGQAAAGVAAARLSVALRQKRRPSSAPSPAAVSKKSSVFGGLVQTLVESNVRTRNIEREKERERATKKRKPPKSNKKCPVLVAPTKLTHL